MRTKHAPGWKWRKEFAGSVWRPWPVDHPPQVSGLCEKEYHEDCPQASVRFTDAGNGQCSCPCHRTETHL